MEDILRVLGEALNTWGKPVFLMALAVILAVGVVKIFTKLLPGKGSKFAKFMNHFYVVLAFLFAWLAESINWHFFIGGACDWGRFVTDVLAVFACSQSLYPLYEKFGGRALITAIFCKGAKAGDIMSSIDKCLKLTDEQKAKLEAQIKQDL